MENRIVGVIIILMCTVGLSGWMYYNPDTFKQSPTSTSEDRDIDLAYLTFAVSLTPDEKAENFLIYFYDPNVGDRPDGIDLIYDYVSAAVEYKPQFSTLPEEFFIHGKGLDPTNPDNRLRTTGYNEYRLDLSNPILKTYQLDRLNQVITDNPNADGLLLDLVYSNFRFGSYYFTIARETVVTSDGLTVDVSGMPFTERLVGRYKNPILVTTDPAQLTANKYAGTFSGNQIDLVGNDYQSLSSNTDLEEWEDYNNLEYFPQGIRPSEFSTAMGYAGVVYHNVVTRVSDAHSGLYAAKLDVSVDDVNWARRLNSGTKQVGVGTTVRGSAWIKNLGNVSQICLTLEGRKDGGAYLWSSTCIDSPAEGEWLRVEDIFDLPVDNSCNGESCDQIMMFVSVRSMNPGTTTASFIIDDMTFEKFNPTVAPGTTLYVSYGARAEVPDVEGTTNYHYYMKSYLEDLKASMPSDKYLFINEYEAGNTDYLPYIDGGQFEGFVRAYWTTDYDYIGRDEGNWKAELDRVQNVLDQGKYAVTMCGVYQGMPQDKQDRVFNFCFPSYLLIQDPGRTGFFFREYNEDWWFRPEYDWQYGTPIEEYHTFKDTSVYSREYTKSIVFVNPTDAPIQINLDLLYYNLAGDPINTVLLDSQAGVVLFKAAEYVPSQEIKGAIFIIVLIGILLSTAAYFLIK